MSGEHEKMSGERLGESKKSSKVSFSASYLLPKAEHVNVSLYTDPGNMF